jgi:hypothetical protein
MVNDGQQSLQQSALPGSRASTHRTPQARSHCMAPPEALHNHGSKLSIVLQGFELDCKAVSLETELPDSHLVQAPMKMCGKMRGQEAANKSCRGPLGACL